MKIAKFIFAGVLIATSLLTGCATRGLSEEQINNATIADVPTDYKSKIPKFLSPLLIDPKSAEYTFDTQAPKRQAVFFEGKPIVVWEVIVEVNAKNSQGGYTGRKIYGFNFHNGAIANVSPISERGDSATAIIKYSKYGSTPNQQRMDMELNRIRANSQLTDLSHLD